MKEQFIIFLKKHRCYRKYFQYIKHRRTLESIDDFFATESTSLLSGAFVWDIANEQKEYNQKDYDYWKRLDRLWRKSLKS